MNMVTPKAAAKLDPLFNKLASEIKGQFVEYLIVT